MPFPKIKGTSVTVEGLEVSAYRIPTDFPESDGTLAWDHTTLVVFEASAGGMRGLGFGYANAATARLIADQLATVVQGQDAMAVPGIWGTMIRAIRNLGRPGVASMAIAAVDAALWNLKARLLDLPLVTLLGPVRDGVPVYGSGGFTSYAVAQLREQLGTWVGEGIPRRGRHRPDMLRPIIRSSRQGIGRALTGSYAPASVP